MCTYCFLVRIAAPPGHYAKAELVYLGKGWSPHIEPSRGACNKHRPQIPCPTSVEICFSSLRNHTRAFQDGFPVRKMRILTSGRLGRYSEGVGKGLPSERGLCKLLAYNTYRNVSAFLFLSLSLFCECVRGRKCTSITPARCCSALHVVMGRATHRAWSPRHALEKPDRARRALSLQRFLTLSSDANCWNTNHS